MTKVSPTAQFLASWEFAGNFADSGFISRRSPYICLNKSVASSGISLLNEAGNFPMLSRENVEQGKA
jgi:hypothetical protein